MVHGGALAGWAVLPALRLSQYPVRHRASDHDASVPRLPEAAHVLAQDRDGDAGLAARLSNMARRDLPGGDEPQGGFVDEAPPRPGHRPEVRVVSRTPHSRGVEGGRRSVRRSGRGRRGLYRRQAQEHAEVQARGDEGRRFPRGQDHRRRRQGSTDEQGERGRGRGHGRLDAPELRRGPWSSPTPRSTPTSTRPGSG